MKRSFFLPGLLVAISLWATIAAIAFGLGASGCVGGKLSPLVPEIVSALDTAGCELVTVYVQNQEAGDVCDTASKFFNGLLADFSAPASLPARAVLPTATPHKYPVRWFGVTVGHFRRPFEAMVQAKLDALQADAGALDGGVPGS